MKIIYAKFSQFTAEAYAIKTGVKNSIVIHELLNVIEINFDMNILDAETGDAISVYNSLSRYSSEKAETILLNSNIKNSAIHSIS